MAEDMVASLKWMCSDAVDSSIKGKLDCDNLGIAGMSMGALNTHLAASNSFNIDWFGNNIHKIKAAVSIHNGGLDTWKGGKLNPSLTNHLYTGGTADSYTS